MYPSLPGKLSPALAGYTVISESMGGSEKASRSSREEQVRGTDSSEKQPARSNDGKGAMAARLRRATSAVSLKVTSKRRAETFPDMPTAGAFHRRSDDMHPMQAGYSAMKAGSFPVTAAEKNATAASGGAPTRTEVLWNIKRMLASDFMSDLLAREGMTSRERSKVKSNFVKKEFPETMSGEEILHRLPYQHGKEVREKISRLEEEITVLEQRVKALEQPVEALGQRVEALERIVEGLENANASPEQREANRLGIKHFQSRLDKKRFEFDEKKIELDEKKIELEEKRFELDETLRPPSAKLQAAYSRKLAEIDELPDSSDFSPEQRAIMAYILLHAPCMGKTDEDVAKVVELNVKKVMDAARHMTKEGVVIEALANRKQDARMKARSNNKNVLDQIAARLHVQKSPDQVRDAALRTVRTNVKDSLEHLRSTGTLVQTVQRLLNMEEIELETRLALLEAERDALKRDTEAMGDKREERLEHLSQEIRKIEIALMDAPDAIMKRAHSGMADTLQKRDRALTPEQALIAGYLYLHAAFPGMNDEKIARKLNSYSSGE